MNTTERVWRRQFDGLCRAIEARDAVALGDGFTFILSERVPQSLLDTYNSMVQVGYARGWL